LKLAKSWTVGGKAWALVRAIIPVRAQGIGVGAAERKTALKTVAMWITRGYDSKGFGALTEEDKD